MENKKMPNKKLTTTLFIIGIILFPISIVLMVIGGTSFLFTIGMFLMPVGFLCLMLGLYPKIAKGMSKIYSETMDYAGKDISTATNKTADVVSPAVQTLAKNIKNPSKKCPSCGEQNDMENNFCSKCGASLSKKCPACGENNEIKNEYCSKCGNKL